MHGKVPSPLECSARERDATAAQQLRVTRLPGLFTSAIAPSAVRGRFWREAGRRFTLPRRSRPPVSSYARRDDWRSGCPSWDSPREQRRPGDTRSIVIRELPRLAYLVGRVSTSVTAGRGFSSRTRHCPHTRFTRRRANIAASQALRRLVNRIYIENAKKTDTKASILLSSGVSGSGVVGYRSGQTQVSPAGRYAASHDLPDGRIRMRNDGESTICCTKVHQSVMQLETCAKCYYAISNC